MYTLRRKKKISKIVFWSQSTTNKYWANNTNKTSASITSDTGQIHKYKYILRVAKVTVYYPIELIKNFPLQRVKKNFTSPKFKVLMVKEH